MLVALLVCSEEATIRTVTRVFKDLGVDVDPCLDHKSAERKLSSRKFDAIVVDDEVDGAASLLESARELPALQKSVRIILAGAPKTVAPAFERGTQIVLYKPLSSERVRHGLRAVRNLMAQERRGGFKRVRVELAAKLSYGKFTNRPIMVEDLSDSGAAIRSDNPLPASARLGFECALPETDEVLKAKAEVVWQDTRGGVGIRFLDIPAQSRKKLADWLATQSVASANSSPETVLIEAALKAGR